ncbi:MAG: prepilin-type N-terminal cleavage/methylation domain-containing protein [bacterium]
MRYKNNRGFTLAETLLALTIFSLMMLIIVRLYVQTQTSIRKSQQLTDLQQLAKVSLNEITRELRQTMVVRTTQPGDIPVGSNFTLAPAGTNQLVIYVPKITNPQDRGVADRITYKMGTYNGKPNRLLQQLTTFTRDISGNVVVDVNYPLVPIINYMDAFRINPLTVQGNPLQNLFNDGDYSYDNVTFWWDYDPNPDDPRGILALGLTVSSRDGRKILQNRLTLTTVVTSRPITGVPR